MSKDTDSVLKRYDPKKARYSKEAIRSKLVAVTAKEEGRNVPKPDYNIDSSSVRSVIDGSSEHITDAKSVFEVLPDTKLARDILVSCIMSPNDMIANEILFRTKTSLGEDEATSLLLGVVEEYFTNEVNLSKLCVPALEDMLFMTGSYPIIAVPRSGIDKIINGESVSVESVQEDFDDELNIKNIGFLSRTETGDTGDGEQKLSLESIIGNTTRSTEAIKVNDLVSLVDNPTVLKKPLFMERVREERSRNLLDLMNFNTTLTVSNEDGGDEKTEIKLYDKRKFKNTPFMELMDVDEVGDDEPIFFHPPSESIIPINVPGDVTRKVGYFIVLDNTGNPVSIATSKKHWDRLKNHSDVDSDTSELTRIREQLFGAEEHKDLKTVKEMHRAYTTHLERRLHDSLSEGVHGENAEIELSEEAEMLMMSRALGRMKTQLLYIPKELMVYMAFDYNELGVGKSLLESTKIISSMRAMMLLANTQAGMRNSTPGTLLDIELDPLDKDPDQTVERVLTLREQANRGSYPLGNLDLTNIANSLNRSGVQVSVSNHPAYPQTKITSSDISRSVSTVDTDLEDRLRDRHHQGWGVTPEMIDATRETDFAANVIMSNKLMVKRVSVYQAMFTDMLTEVMKLFIRLSPRIQQQFAEKLKEAKVEASKQEEILTAFIEAVEAGLPSPDSSKVTTQLEELESYIAILDQSLEAYFSEELLDGLVDSDLEDAIAPTQVAIRSYFIRNWLRSNNVLPELESLLMIDNGETILDQHSEFIEDILKLMSEKLRKTGKIGRDHDVKSEEDMEEEDRKREEAEAARQEEEDALNGETDETLDDDNLSGDTDNLDDSTGETDENPLGGEEDTPNEDDTDVTDSDALPTDNTDGTDGTDNPPV